MNVRALLPDEDIMIKDHMKRKVIQPIPQLTSGEFLGFRRLLEILEPVFHQFCQAFCIHPVDQTF